jgi:hypothetical protein
VSLIRFFELSASSSAIPRPRMLARFQRGREERGARSEEGRGEERGRERGRSEEERGRSEEEEGEGEEREGRRKPSFASRRPTYPRSRR